VLDADEKLWPGLLLTEFKWKKTERRGKGRNKKNKKMEQINYRERYGKLYREHEVPLAPLAPQVRIALTHVWASSGNYEDQENEGRRGAGQDLTPHALCTSLDTHSASVCLVD
jgi:hypothetical protein